jgi:hypothetical protein
MREAFETLYKVSRTLNPLKVTCTDNVTCMIHETRGDSLILPSNLTHNQTLQYTRHSMQMMPVDVRHWFAETKLIFLFLLVDRFEEFGQYVGC